MCALPVADVRLRGVRTHHQGAGSALHSPEGETPVQPRAAQVLRQEALQVHQLELCKHVAPSTHLNILGSLQSYIARLTKTL